MNQQTTSQQPPRKPGELQKAMDAWQQASQEAGEVRQALQGTIKLMHEMEQTMVSHPDEARLSGIPMDILHLKARLLTISASLREAEQRQHQSAERLKAVQHNITAYHQLLDRIGAKIHEKHETITRLEQEIQHARKSIEQKRSELQEACQQLARLGG
ncbi:MAG: hypothetical protein HC837_19890 [Chloroflexaceae bacterium]|nr:hypothetical protein [Chloroflexaceae bacterium]